MLAHPHPDPRGFDHVTTWIFDLDNTLYPAECDLFAQVDQKMGEFISGLLGVDRVAAKAIQKSFYIEHGTTLAGLMRVHDVEPARFLDYVHDIDYAAVPELPALAKAIESLPGRRLVFTNGSRGHAERVMDRLGLAHLFEGTFDITDAGFVPKPRPEAYDRFLSAYGVDAAKAAMFEDLPQNLNAAHALGMTTVLVHSDLGDHPIYAEMRQWQRLPDHVHHMTRDLTQFLTGMRPAAHR